MNRMKMPGKMILTMVDAAWNVAGVSMKISMGDGDVDEWPSGMKGALQLSTLMHYNSRKREDGGREREGEHTMNT